MENNRAEVLRRQIEFYRQCLRRTSGADVAAIYLRQLTAAELELSELEKISDH
jgi:hypothetical protein